jgi:NADPH2:quinone reductase
VLIRVTRAGINFADTHARENAYWRGTSSAHAWRRGRGRRARWRRVGAGQRVVALVADGGYAEFVAADAATTFPIADGVSDATALALLLQG